MAIVCNVVRSFGGSHGKAKGAHLRGVNYWEIIANNLKKRGWSLGWVSAWTCKAEQSGLLTHIATTESALLCMPTKSSARLLNLNRE
jgi:hypothetical protein